VMAVILSRAKLLALDGFEEDLHVPVQELLLGSRGLHVS